MGPRLFIIFLDFFFEYKKVFFGKEIFFEKFFLKKIEKKIFEKKRNTQKKL